MYVIQREWACFYLKRHFENWPRVNKFMRIGALPLACVRKRAHVCSQIRDGLGTWVDRRFGGEGEPI